MSQTVAEQVKAAATALAAIQEHAAGQRGIANVIPCPACGTGQLHYSVARSNGHIHARCSTPGCVTFMQ